MWKWIPMFENRYKITDDGLVIFVDKNYIENVRTPVLDKNGYETVNLKIGKKVYCKKIHRLVAEAFIEGDASLHVNHIDGNKRNNNVTNLEWLSNADNMRHAIALQLKPMYQKYSNNTTGYYGVTKSGSSYIAQLKRKGVNYRFGRFNTPEEAAEAVNAAILKELLSV